MSEHAPATAEPTIAQYQDQVLSLYIAVMVLMLLGIGLLVVYSILLGPLTSPGAESSFGYALSLGFVMAAVMAHVADQAYRVWPLGRKALVFRPMRATDLSLSRGVAALVLVAAAAAIGYLLWILVTS